MERYIDLHTHTTASDGFLTPSGLVKLAAEKGLAALAVTDHDSIRGVREAVLKGIEYGVEVIPGVEFSADFDTEMHILGYFIDTGSLKLNQILNTIAGYRVREIVRTFAKLNETGIEITAQEVKESTGIVEINSIIKVMIQKGYISNRNEAYERYFAAGRPAYVKSRKLPPMECIELIKAAGGISVLAHPIRLKKNDTELECVLKELKAYGLKGMECLHSEHSRELQEKYLVMAEKHNLLATGGSDFHGGNKVGIELGVGHGDLKIPYAMLENMKRVYGNEKRDTEETNLYTEYLGKNVHVVIDRPLGAKHPVHGFEYTVNYGYLPGTVAGDNEEIDAYVLGENAPVKTFDGIVIAVIKRKNDSEDKLVVAKASEKYTREDIARLTQFQEQFFDTEIICL